MDRPPLSADDIRLSRILMGPVGLPIASDDPTRLPVAPDPERDPRDDRDEEMERLSEVRRRSVVRPEVLHSWILRTPRRRALLEWACGLAFATLVAYCLAWWASAGRELVHRHDPTAQESHVR